MKLIHQITLFFLLLATSFSGGANPGGESVGLHLFTDREFCVAGDTLWIKVFLTNETGSASNVVHVDLSLPDSRVIASVSMKSHEGWAEGYLHVPDTLNSGFCFLSAYLYEQQLMPGIPVETKSLVVYNRFQKGVSEMMLPDKNFMIAESLFDSEVSITTGKTEFFPRDRVFVDLDLADLAPDEIATVLVRASLADELVLKHGGRFLSNTVEPVYDFPRFQEQDGFLLSGTVQSQRASEQPNYRIVFLSLIDDPGYFDYYVTDVDGAFHFYLKNAIGFGDVVLQAVSAGEEVLDIELTSNRRAIHAPLPMHVKLIGQAQSAFIDHLTDAGFLKRLFEGEKPVPEIDFSMPPRFQIPFYGQPDRTVYPDEFFALPDLRSIARELLPGVQYRIKEKDASIRLFNRGEDRYSEDEPFKLINGIPVFKNSLLSDLGSSDIQWIDYSLQERVFGDLRFPGVLAVYLKDRSNSWIVNHPNTYQFTVHFLQHDHLPPDYMPVSDEKRIPDTRTVFYWNSFQTGVNSSFEFVLSDLTGPVEILVEGVTKNGQIFRSSKTIVVK